MKFREVENLIKKNFKTKTVNSVLKQAGLK
jgi:hypothetical protein